MADSSSLKNKGSTKKAAKATQKNGFDKKGLSIEKFKKAISGTGGIISQVAERMGCSRVTVYAYIQKHPELKEAYEDEKETILDICEEGLLSKIYSQDFEAIKYYLERKGKSRGYGGLDRFGKGPDDAAVEEKQIVGVLVTPGLIGEDVWEAAAQKV